ncbi:MAG: hypothetical protein KBA42_06410 [Bacteroidales bacterium]|nr:hypothetical protein [Bacteroidales bacterium]MBP9028563.1 hypothetical protein [Bacteroidales bacterium]HRR11040.1 hypothetical protein [Tenuifilum sp.]
MRIAILLATITGLAVSCSHSPRPRTSNPGLADTILGKSISFPKGLALIANEELNNPDSLLENIGLTPFVVTIIDASCPKCIVYHLNAVDSILCNNLPEYVGRVYVLNIKPIAVRHFFRELYPEIRVCRAVLLADTSYQFERANGINATANPNNRVFMVADGRIAAYGDPIYQPGLVNQYLNELIQLYSH